MKLMESVYECVLSVVSCSLRASEALRKLPTEKWGFLLEIARSNKIAPFIYKNYTECIPAELRVYWKQEYDKNVDNTRKHIEVLSSIVYAAQTQCMRFVLIKGLGFARMAYGDVASRWSNDIDILIASEDATRCDYILRNSEFFQPDWTLAANAKTKAISQALQIKSQKSIPYLLRRKAHDVEYAPYYNSEHFIRVEVHDGFRFIDRKTISSLLWMTRNIEIEGVTVCVLDIEASLFCLLISMYENANTIYGKFDGAASYRDYLDLAMFLRAYDKSINSDKFQKLVYESHTESMIKRVLCDTRTLFENGSAPARVCNEILNSEIITSSKQAGLPPTFNTKSACKEAFDYIRNKCRYGDSSKVAYQIDAVAGSSSPDCIWIKYENRYNLEIN